MGRTLRRALAAVRALLVVNDCYVVVHGDRAVLTLLGAERTADTADVTFRLDVLALVVGVTLNKMLCAVGNQVD